MLWLHLQLAVKKTLMKGVTSLPEDKPVQSRSPSGASLAKDSDGVDELEKTSVIMMKK